MDILKRQFRIYVNMFVKLTEGHTTIFELWNNTVNLYGKN